MVTIILVFLQNCSSPCYWRRPRGCPCTTGGSELMYNWPTLGSTEPGGRPTTICSGDGSWIRQHLSSDSTLKRKMGGRIWYDSINYIFMHPWGGGAGSPSNTMWPGPRLTCMPSFILIHQTVWPQYTNVTARTGRTDRTDRQRSDSIGQTVL